MQPLEAFGALLRTLLILPGLFDDSILRASKLEQVKEDGDLVA